MTAFVEKALGAAVGIALVDAMFRGGSWFVLALAAGANVLFAVVAAVYQETR